jgi:uncharacterized linocin/CFP29 family protein
MLDFLQRDQAPLGDDEWGTLDDIVVRTAQSTLVGRRVLTVVGPFGPGAQALQNDVIVGSEVGKVDLMGSEDDEAIGIEQRQFLPLPVIYKDFWVHWRDLAAARRYGVGLDPGKAAAAAAAAAQAEDRLIFHGHPSLDLPGLTTVEGRQVLPLSDWSEMGRAFADVVAGVQRLIDAGFTGPYALVVSPRLYAHLNRIFDNTGVLEFEQVEKLARRGVYPTAILREPSALLLDSGAQNMDRAVGVDLSTAYVESNNLNHRFRVLETLVLRIRRLGAILAFESGPARPA